MADESKAPVMGIKVVGMVMEKEERITDRGVKYQVNLAVPGIKEVLRVEVEAAIYVLVKTLETWGSLVTYNAWKGNVYWKAVKA